MKVQGIIFVAMFFVAAFHPTGASGGEVSSWGKFHILENPQIRLTFLVQSAYLESVEKEIDQAPKLSKFLMGKTSLEANERKLAIKEYREWWLAKEAGHVRQLGSVSGDIQISSKNLRDWFESEIQSEPPSALRRKRMLFVQTTLRAGFADSTLNGFRAIERLESEKDLGARLIGLTEALGHMAKDEARLETLASLSNLLLVISLNDGVSESNRNRLKPHAVALSKKLDKAIRDSDQIDVLNPAGLVGGAVVFKAVGKLALKSPTVLKVLGLWSNAPVVAKATIASTAGHAAVLTSLNQSKGNSPDSISKEAEQRLQSDIGVNLQSVLARKAGPKNDSISLDAVRVRAEELLYSKADFKSAWKYAELIGYGERLLVSSEIFDLANRGLETTDFIEKRDSVMLRFERYMAKRGLKVVDADALAMLKAFVDEYIPSHKDGQPFALVSTLRPERKGNCVSRTLALTAMFYPAYLRYENPDLKFGLMFWEDHMEAVLVNTKTKSAMSIHSMIPLDLKTSPSVISPRALAGAFLYRSVSPRLFGSQTGRSADLYPRSRLVITKAKAAQVKGQSDLTTLERDRDPNPSPFTTALYADQLLVGAQKPLLDSRISTDPSSGGLRDVRNLMAALVGTETFDELRAKSNEAFNARIQAARSAPPVPDPFTTVLSTNEFARLVPSRSPMKFPFVFLRADEWWVTERTQIFLRRSETPHKNASDIEAVLRKELKELQDNSTWRRLAMGEGQSIAEFTSGVDFQFELMDFSEIILRLKGLNVGRVDREMREFPFRYGVEDLIEILGVNDEFSEIQKAAANVLAPIIEDKSGRGLFRFLQSADTMRNSDRVRQIQGLFVAYKVSGQSDRLAKLLGQLDIKVARQQPKETKKVGEDQVRFDWSKSKPLVVHLVPTEPKGRLGDGPMQDRRIKMSLSPEVVFLLLHYFNTDVPESRRLVDEIAESEEFRASTLKFSSKFFGWLPGIDVHGTWQNQLANGWVDLSQTVCNPPEPVGSGADCITLHSYPSRTICKAGNVSAPSPAVDPMKTKACEFLATISSELIFDELFENFDRPDLN